MIRELPMQPGLEHRPSPRVESRVQGNREPVNETVV
jgi:hypothetical protein